jgi:digeranylgeranylglycerophospholipid reductase
LQDVLVVGGGPIGSYIASRLAGMGYEVAVLEQKEKLGGRVCCTGIISPECLSSFTIDSSVVLSQANSARLYSPSGKLIRMWRKENQVYIIDRAALDLSMANRARAAGADYSLNCPVKDIEVKSDRVVVEAVQNGSSINTEARVVVIATGFGSRLIEELGLSRAGDFVIGAQAEVETRGIDEVEVYLGQEVAPGFFAWLVPVNQRKAMVGLLSHRSPDFYLRRLISSLTEQGKIVSGEVKPSYRGITLKPPRRTYGKRLIVVGDAAGQVKPTTGGGIYFGLLCAEIAARNINRALEKNDLSAGGLAGYEREWKKKIGKELKICHWARKFYENLNDEQVNRIFDIIKANGIEEALLEEDDLSFDWHGKAIMRLTGKTALSKVFDVMKLSVKIGTS